MKNKIILSLLFLPLLLLAGCNNETFMKTREGQIFSIMLNDFNVSPEEIDSMEVIESRADPISIGRNSGIIHLKNGDEYIVNSTGENRLQLAWDIKKRDKNEDDK